METDSFVESIVFSDEATFHLSGKVNGYNVHIWGAANPHVIVEHICIILLLTCLICRCILVKTGKKISLGRLWPLMGLEPRDYIHNKTLEYALSNNISFIVVSLAILFL